MDFNNEVSHMAPKEKRNRVKSMGMFLLYLIFKHGILTSVLFCSSFGQKAQVYFGELSILNCTPDHIGKEEKKRYNAKLPISFTR